jgi:lipopolysaccharide/colanic/teichoic acid biosynthesis glycosyltransferase
MKAFPLRLKNKSIRCNGVAGIRANSLVDSNTGIYVDTYFNDMLCLERKRSERSNKPFLLMLISMHKVTIDGVINLVANTIVKALLECTRETDIKGWYKHDTVIGIIFTEIGDAGEVISKDAVFNKVYKYLCAYLDKNIVDNLELSVYAYPEESHKQPPNSSPTECLYPDVVTKLSPTGLLPIAKRVIDIVGSLACLLLFAPLFLIFSLIVKFSSEGPVIFKQERIGQFGKKFKMFKFRSMYLDNDPSIHKDFYARLICGNVGGGNGAAYKIQNDPRVTQVGRFLRKTSLDELPQFFNVLVGDMSLVGPRPPIAYEVERYDIWHKRRVLEVKPGITGLWQVSGRSATTFDDMVRLDLKYVREWSLWLDIKLLLKTPWVLLTGKGGY